MHLNKVCEIHAKCCRSVNAVTKRQFSFLMQLFLQESKEELEILNKDTSS